jgi:recombination associated protein RdgC
LFKNLIVYRIGPGWAANSAELEAGLEKMIFVECGATVHVHGVPVMPATER